jgi:hypothetical protein
MVAEDRGGGAFDSGKDSNGSSNGSSNQSQSSMGEWFESNRLGML